jgi:hypothetical protein
MLKTVHQVFFGDCWFRLYRRKGIEAVERIISREERFAPLMLAYSKEVEALELFPAKYEEAAIGSTKHLGKAIRG